MYKVYAEHENEKIYEIRHHIETSIQERPNHSVCKQSIQALATLPTRGDAKKL